MSAQAHPQFPAEIVLSHGSAESDDLSKAENVFYRSSTNGTTLSSHRDISITPSLPHISALNLGVAQSRLSLDEFLSRGTLGSVHRGSIERDHPNTASSASASSSVIIKLVVGEDKLVLLKHEAFIYQYVKHLQGSVLPHCYGFYQDERRTAGFILLEDCGTPYGQGFKALPDNTKMQVMQALKQVHDAGIEHGDLQPWNILNYQGSSRIVDWHLAMIHGCPAKRDLIMTEEFCCHEGISELACEELVAIGERMVFRSQDQILYG